MVVFGVLFERAVVEVGGPSSGGSRRSLHVEMRGNIRSGCILIVLLIAIIMSCKQTGLALKSLLRMGAWRELIMTHIFILIRPA